MASIGRDRFQSDQDKMIELCARGYVHILNGQISFIRAVGSGFEADFL